MSASTEMVGHGSQMGRWEFVQEFDHGPVYFAWWPRAGQQPVFEANCMWPACGGWHGPVRSDDPHGHALAMDDAHHHIEQVTGVRREWRTREPHRRPGVR